MNFTYQAKLFDIEGTSQDDHIFEIIKSTQSFYEADLLKYMYSFLRHSKEKNTVAIDVGANIGNHSIFMRSFLSDYLIAVEPNPNVLPILQRNLSKNITDYTVFDCAVGETDRTAIIAVPDDAKNNEGMAKVSFDGVGDRINVTTLDSIFDNWQKSRNEQYSISVIKIDVEGMELAVLKGAEQIILKHKPNIFAEAATAEEYEKLNSYLERIGYKKLSRWADTPVYHFGFKPTFRQILRVRRAELFRKIRTFRQILRVRRAELFRKIRSIKSRFNLHV